MAKITLSSAEQSVVDKVIALVEKSGSAEYQWDHEDVRDLGQDIRKARVRAVLSDAPHHIYVRITPNLLAIGKVGGSAPAKAAPAPTVPASAKQAGTPIAPQKPKGIPGYKKHTYVVPKFHEDLVKAITDSAALVVCGVGPTGSGKTEHMRLIAAQLDMSLMLVNCRKDMDSAGFTGEKTVEPDPETKASVIKFLHGPIVRAMRTGLDEQGNEVGKPALLVLDEFVIIPSWLGMTLNNLLEPGSGRRKLVLPENGGEVVTAHSGFRIVLLGNTIGRGTTMAQAEYTAQGDALDISTLDRIGAIFNYGYSRKAEESVLNEKIGDDGVVRKTLKLRDALRAARKSQGLKTPFSTRLLVSLADNYRVFGGDMAKAYIYGVLNKVMPEEKAVYAEAFYTNFGVRLETLLNDPDVDYDY